MKKIEAKKQVNKYLYKWKHVWNGGGDLKERLPLYYSLLTVF